MSFRIAPPAAGPAIPRSAPVVPASSSPRFGELVAAARTQTSATAAPQMIPPAERPTGSAPRASVLGDIGRQLLARVARGERAVESMVRQGLSGRAFTPQDLLAMQAHVYRYGQELELVSKLAERGTSTVKTVLQQNG